MSIELKVPALPESVADATIATWHKKPGDAVARDENIVDLETDKVVLEVPAPEAGILGEILYATGSTVTAGQLLATIEPSDSKASDTKAKAVAELAAASQEPEPPTSPAVRRLLAAHDLDAKVPEATGKEGRLTKNDVVDFIEQRRTAAPLVANVPATSGRNEQRVPMSRLRAKVAERLVAAQHSAAMLTTFNEVNLHAIMSLRHQYKESFEKKHGVKLGFMSFFTKAVVLSLQRFPILNASIDGQDIVYHGFFDIGIAVTTDRGLVVPIVRDADQLSLAEIEQNITESAGRARSGKLSLNELQGGTFTITNGGIFGSLLSTPIINPPQTAILGMHKIQERPIAENGQIVIRPMMYLALSYDHRLIDGKDSVQFLVSVKSLLEDPSRLLLNV